MNKTIQAVIVSSILSFSSAVSAFEESSLYLIGELGKADTDVEGIDGDDDDMLAVGIGYQLHQYVSAEAIWSDFGTISDTVNDATEVDVEVESLSLSIHGYYNRSSQLVLYVRIGLDIWDMDISSSDLPSDSGVDFVWGAGINYQLIERLAIRGELATRSFQADQSTDAEVNSWKLSLLYKL